jgi:hypothetical protein
MGHHPDDLGEGIVRSQRGNLKLLSDCGTARNAIRASVSSTTILGAVPTSSGKKSRPSISLAPTVVKNPGLTRRHSAVRVSQLRAVVAS